LKIVILFYVAIVLVNCINSAATNPLISLVGIHAKLIFITIMFLSVEYFSSIERIRSFLWFLLIALSAESILAVIQYRQDPAWWYDTMNISREAKVIDFKNIGREQMTRTGSIFAHAGRFGQFVLIGSIVLLGSAELFRKKISIWVVGITLIFAGGVFIQNSRTVMFLFVLASAVILLSSRYSRSLMAVLSAPFIAVAFWGVGLDNNLLDAYAGSETWKIGRYDSVTGRVDRGWVQIKNAMRDTGVLGHGTGTCSQGMHQVTGSSQMPKENGYAALIWEFGMIGPLLWLAVMGTLLGYGYQAYRQVKHTPYDSLARSIVVLIGASFVLQYIGLQYMENYLVMTHFWAFCGILFALPRLVKSKSATRTPSSR